MFDTTYGLRCAPVAFVQFGCMAATTHLLALVHEEQAGRQGESFRNLANTSIRYIRKIGKPYGTSVQHALMLDKMVTSHVDTAISVSRLRGSSDF